MTHLLFSPQGKFHLEDPTGAVQLDLAKAISFLKYVWIINVHKYLSVIHLINYNDVTCMTRLVLLSCYSYSPINMLQCNSRYSLTADIYQFHTGLFTENCFVLAEGWYEDEVFHVNGFGFPPAEPADTTR